MENEIIGEKLKGLYSAIQGMEGRELVEGKVREEVGKMAAAAVVVTEELATVSSNLGATMLERDRLRADMAQACALYHSSQEELTSISRTAKDKLAYLQGKITVMEEEKEKNREHGSKIDKQYKDLVEEYGKLRVRLKQFHQKRKLFEEFEEKVCKNCQKVFIENTNFNWSCKTHYSEYSGEMYWCCGLPGKDAPGCRVGKHLAKDDDEDDPVLDTIQKQNTTMCSVSDT